MIITEHGWEFLGFLRLISWHQRAWAYGQGRPFVERSFYTHEHKGWD